MSRAGSSAPPQGVAPKQRLVTVLVVEDDPDQQWRLARLLTVHGFRVVGTSSADGALALFEQRPMDLVLVDERLPGIEGIALAQRLRQRFPSVPVVLMSEAPGDELEEDAARIGVRAVVAKPLEREQIARLLEELDRDRPGEDPTAQRNVARLEAGRGDSPSGSSSLPPPP